MRNSARKKLGLCVAFLVISSGCSKVYTLSTDDLEPPQVTVAYGPDGQRILRGGSVEFTDPEVVVVDASTGEEFLSLTGTAVAFSPNGERIVSGGDGVVNVWDATTGEKLLSLTGHVGQVSYVEINADGQRIASRSNDGVLKLWNAVTGEEVQTPEHEFGKVACVALSPNGQWIVSAGTVANSGGFIIISRANNGEEHVTVKNDDKYIRCVAFSPDSQRIVTGGHSLKIWDVSTGRESSVLRTNDEDMFFRVAFSPDGKKIASRSWSMIQIWDAQTGEQLVSKGPIGGTAFAFSPDSESCASSVDLGGHHNRRTSIWNATTGKETVSLDADVCDVEFSADGRRLASTNSLGFMRVWSATSGDLVWETQIKLTHP